MEVLFSRSGNALSRVIRYLTGEPVSHCAIRLCDDLVVHFNLLGLQVWSLREFLDHAQVLYSVDFSRVDDLDQFYSIVQKYATRAYDFGGLAYLALRCLIPWLPRANLWQTTGMFLCTEFVTSLLTGEEDHLITPYQLYRRLVDSNNKEAISL